MLSFSKQIPENTMLIYFSEGISDNTHISSFLEKIYKENKPIIDSYSKKFPELKRNLFEIYRFQDEVKLRTIWKTLVYINSDSELFYKFKNEVYRRYPALVSACQKQDMKMVYEYSERSDIYIITAASVICFIMEQEYGNDLRNWDSGFYELSDFLEKRAKAMKMYYEPVQTNGTIPSDMALFYEASENWQEFSKMSDNCTAIIKIREKDVPIVLKTTSSPVITRHDPDKFEFVADSKTMLGQMMNKFGIDKITDVVKVQRFIEYAFTQEGVDFAYFFENCLKKKEADITLEACMEIEEEISERNHDDVAAYLFTLWIRNMLKEYKAAKKLAIKLIDEKSSSFKSLEAKIIALTNEKQSLHKELDRIRLSLSEIKEKHEKDRRNDIEALVAENSVLRKQVSKLQDALLRQEEEYKQELNALREFVFKMEQEYDEVEDIEDSREKLLKAIEGKKIVVFGGPDPFIIKMRGIYKDILFYSGTNKNIDTTSIVKNADFVFIYSNHMVHAFYYRLIGSCRTTGAKYGYLGYRQNPKYIEEEMLEYLKNL